MGTPTEVLRVLRYGGVVILPTETVYGVAARADDEEAVKRLYAIKGRSFDKPLALCIKDTDVAEGFARFDDKARSLADAFWPGPLTLVLPLLADSKAAMLSPQMVSTNEKGEKTIALRCPDIIWREDIGNMPIALTSANTSGDPAPSTAKDAAKAIGYEVDDMWLGADCPEAIPSTIVTLAEDTPRILRQGAVASADLAPWIKT